jgi:phage shock protein C
MEKKLYRDELRKKIGGVCAGLADHFGMDVSLLRILFVLSAVFLHGVGLVAYVVLWISLPKKDFFFGNPHVDYKVPPQDAYNPFRNTPPNFSAADFDKPFGGFPAKKTNAGVIAGAILIVLGTVFLLRNFDFIPDIDHRVLWPLVIVGIGLAFIFSGAKKQPWEKQEWTKNEPEVKADDTSEEKTNDNPPTV